MHTYSKKVWSFKLSRLALAVAVAASSGAAFAATPAANQLPGQGAVDAQSPTKALGAVSIDTAKGTMTVPLKGNTVIDWGNGGTAINPSGVKGFNIGSKATVGFTGGSVLNIDQSGLPSGIFGHLNGTGSVFVANLSGVTVGPQAKINAGGVVGLLSNASVNGSKFNGQAGSISYGPTGRAVTVDAGSTVRGNSVFIAGGGQVNVDLTGITASGARGVTLQSGLSNLDQAASAHAANTMTMTGYTRAPVMVKAAGTVTNDGDPDHWVALKNGSFVDGSLINNGRLKSEGTLTVAMQGSHPTGGDFTNNATGIFSGHDVTAAGPIVNSGHFTATNLMAKGSSTGGLAPSVTNNAGASMDVTQLTTGAGMRNDGTFHANYATVHGDLVNNGGKADGGTFVVHKDLTATNEVTNNGDITVTGRATVGNPFPAGDALQNGTDGRFTAGYLVASQGQIDNQGTLIVNHSLTGAADNGMVTNTGYLRAGSITANSGLSNDGQIIDYGNLDATRPNVDSYSVNNGKGGHILTEGTLNTSGAVNNLGSFTINGRGQGRGTVDGNFWNRGTFTEGHGSLLITGGGLQNQAGTFRVPGTLTVSNQFTNGHGVALAAVNNAKGATLDVGTLNTVRPEGSTATGVGGVDNNGTLATTGNIYLAGDLTNGGKVTGAALVGQGNLTNLEKTGASVKLVHSLDLDGSLINQGGTVTTGGGVKLGGNLNSWGKVESAGYVTVAGNASNSGTVQSTGGSIRVDGTVANSGSLIAHGTVTSGRTDPIGGTVIEHK